MFCRRILAQGSLATVEVVRAPTPRGIGTTEPAAPTAVKNNPITNIPASAVPAAAAVATASATRSSYSHLRYIPTPSSVADGSGGGSGTGYTAAPGGGSGRGGWTGREYDYGYHRVPEPQPGPSSPAHLYASSMSSEFLPRSQQPRASPIPTKPDLVDLKAGRGSGAPIYPVSIILLRVPFFIKIFFSSFFFSLSSSSRLHTRTHRNKCVNCHRRNVLVFASYVDQAHLFSYHCHHRLHVGAISTPLPFLSFSPPLYLLILLLFSKTTGEDGGLTCQPCRPNYAPLLARQLATVSCSPVHTRTPKADTPRTCTCTITRHRR